MKRESKLAIGIATAVLAVLGSTAVYAQTKYSPKIAERNRVLRLWGCEDWTVVSSARTDGVLKVIVAIRP